MSFSTEHQPHKDRLSRLSQHISERTEAMHNMKKLILSVFILTFGFATATYAEQVQVNTLLTKKLPEAPGKEIEVITVNYARGAVDTIHLGSYRRGDTLWDIAYR